MKALMDDWNPMTGVTCQATPPIEGVNTNHVEVSESVAPSLYLFLWRN